ncbi:hypothetical protein F2Q69_00032223 [Brassica cretica]|uniref:Uncharacterized protein n=1 Tax=Brassica cretica TaxID=69181 RepID=A0A8S9RSF4_BRACR|nr:hypothetical protein F2Q69_00032223 [Brassica cretica]
MVEDLRVQAKWAALPEVAKLLPLPNFCNIFLQSRPIAWHANDAHLSTMVVEQDVEGITVMSISVEAGAPRESLSDDKKNC